MLIRRLYNTHDLSRRFLVPKRKKVMKIENVSIRIIFRFVNPGNRPSTSCSRLPCDVDSIKMDPDFVQQTRTVTVVTQPETLT
jgi:hypothetical protein